MDQEARDAASNALGKITAHEMLCAERWKNNKDATDRIEASLTDLRRVVNKSVGIVPASFIGVLLTLCGFFGERAFHI